MLHVGPIKLLRHVKFDFCISLLRSSVEWLVELVLLQCWSFQTVVIQVHGTGCSCSAAQAEPSLHPLKSMPTSKRKPVQYLM
eukprot:2552785-Amphidinium_carterae.1